MDRETELEGRVMDIFVHQLCIEVPSVDTDLLSGIVDSLKIVELLVEIEKQLSTRLPIQELEVETFRSIRHIAHFLAERLDLQDKVIVQT
jgi:acyl carrier protein